MRLFWLLQHSSWFREEFFLGGDRIVFMLAVVLIYCIVEYLVRWVWWVMRGGIDA